MAETKFREATALAAVLAAMALVVIDAGAIHVALPTIAWAFSETPARSMMVIIGYQLALLIALLPCAHVADRLGYRPFFLAGVLLFACSAVLSALAPTLPLLVAFRFLQGLGAAAILSLGIALLRVALAPDRLASAIAWNALVVAICSGLAPATGALLLSFAGWRWLFIVALPLAAVVLIAARALPVVKATRRSIDLPGISLYAAAAAAVIVAAHLAGSAPPVAIGIAAGALLCAWRLLVRERGKASPLVPLDLLALPRFRRSVAASILFFTGQSAGLLALPFYIQLSLGRSATTAGLIVAIWPLAVAATSRVTNRLIDRFGSAPVCAAGGILLATGLAAMASWPNERSLAPLAACALACGIGFGLFQVPNNRNMFLSAPASRSAAAGGMQGTARLAGQTAGALLVSFVLSAAPITVAPRLAIGIAATAAAMSGWVSWQRRDRAPIDSDRAPFDLAQAAAKAAAAGP